MLFSNIMGGEGGKVFLFYPLFPGLGWNRFGSFCFGFGSLEIFHDVLSFPNGDFFFQLEQRLIFSWMSLWSFSYFQSYSITSKVLLKIRQRLVLSFYSFWLSIGFLQFRSYSISSKVVKYREKSISKLQNPMKIIRCGAYKTFYYHAF